MVYCIYNTLTTCFGHIITAINHSVASSWFFFSTHMQRCTDKHA